MPRVGFGKAKAKIIIRVGPRSEVVKGVPMGAVALELGLPDGGAVPRERKRLAAYIPETLVAEVVGRSPARVDQESAEVGPRGGGPCGILEVHVAEAVPQTFLRCKVSVPE